MSNPNSITIEEVRSVAREYTLYGDLVSYAPYGSGHINDTLLVTFDQAGREVRYIMQRINDRIFTDVPALMENIFRVSRHVTAKLGHGDNRRSLQLISTDGGQSYCRTESGNWWRLYLFIERATTYDVVESAEQAYEAAKAFGEFQKMTADLSEPRLHETIPGFHNTRSRYDRLLKAVQSDSEGRLTHVREEWEFFRQRESWVDVIIDLMVAGKIPERITHNDTKLNNVMIDDDTGEGICVIDLDTVMPGSALYDFGDLIRTATSPAKEDEADLSKVRMQMKMFEALASGYLTSAGSFLNTCELEHLVFAGKLITLETGIRFLTDFLEGDQYFKVKRPGHNLDRTRTQIALIECIEIREEDMREMVDSIHAGIGTG